MGSFIRNGGRKGINIIVRRKGVFKESHYPGWYMIL